MSIPGDEPAESAQVFRDCVRSLAMAMSESDRTIAKNH
jgi:hypothetical protein